MEVKMPGGRLTKAEIKFAVEFKGLLRTVYSVDDALKALGEWPR